jgi:curved DNA-binding protein CbpA
MVQPPKPELSLSEARAILGVGPEATLAEVKAAYTRLIQLAHPDKGGTQGLAAQLNAARDRLIKRRS